MNGTNIAQTWTEYAVQWAGDDDTGQWWDDIEPRTSLNDAVGIVAMYPSQARLVSRSVSATPWHLEGGES